LGLRDEITDLELKLVGKKAERSISDGAAGEMLSLVVNSVRGTPGFGRDCPLYRAFGYVRKSERKSGLTRKARVTTKGADAAWPDLQKRIKQRRAAVSKKPSAPKGVGGLFLGRVRGKCSEWNRFVRGVCRWAVGGELMILDLEIKKFLNGGDDTAGVVRGF